MRARSGGLGAAALGAALVASACGPDVPPAFVERDSAGVTIAESSRPAWGDEPGWMVEDRPALSLPAWSPPEPRDSFHLSDATRLADGTVVVANGATGQLGFFDPEGRLVKLVGGRGSAPGNHETLRAVHALDESLWTFDHMGRWNAYSLEGEVVASMYMEPTGRGWGLVEPVRDEGIVVVGSFARLDAPVTETVFRRRPPMELVRYDLTGRSLGPFATVAGREETVIVGESGSMQMRSHFDRQPVLHGGRDRVYVGDADRMEILRYRADGSLERIIRVPDFDLSISDEEWEAVKAEFEETFGASRFEELAAEARRAPRPETRPAYSRLLEDADGYLWAAQYEARYGRRILREHVRDWTVFDPDGRWLGTMTLPPALQVVEIGSDYVLGIERADGRSVVRLHRLIRR